METNSLGLVDLMASKGPSQCHHPTVVWYFPHFPDVMLKSYMWFIIAIRRDCYQLDSSLWLIVQVLLACSVTVKVKLLQKNKVNTKNEKKIRSGHCTNYQTYICVSQILVYLTVFLERGEDKGVVPETQTKTKISRWKCKYTETKRGWEEMGHDIHQLRCQNSLYVEVISLFQRLLFIHLFIANAGKCPRINFLSNLVQLFVFQFNNRRQRGSFLAQIIQSRACRSSGHNCGVLSLGHEAGVLISALSSSGLAAGLSVAFGSGS